MSTRKHDINVQYLYDKNVHTKNGKRIICGLESVLNGKNQCERMKAKFASSLFLVNIIPGFVFRSSGIRTYNLSGEALLILVTLI